MFKFSRNAEGVRDAAPWGLPPPHAPPAVGVRAALARLYERVDAALAPVAGACRACGRCCRFDPGGIILFASALEMAHLVASCGTNLHACASRCRLDGAWRCPYQDGDLCGARAVRPIGCRTYFCDAAARALGEQVHADALREVRCIAEGQGPWWYGPARVYLERGGIFC